MSLKIGLVGLPNVGKSTLFNALTEEQNAEAANYPFCTIEPNKAIVAVPDERVDQISAISHAKKLIYATIEFVDVAGLVEGASKGEGLGNKFLGNIRDVDAILHVVRCFDDPNVVHVRAKPDPALDIDIINIELALADMQQLERKIERLDRQVKGDATLRPVLELAQDLLDYLGTGKSLSVHPQRDSEAFQLLNQELRFLSAKPVIYIANVDEDTLTDDNDYVTTARQIASERGAEIIKLCAKLESEIVGLADDERAEYLDLLGIELVGLKEVIRTGYNILGLMSYFTFNEVEVHAWTIKKGWKAPQAAGVIHTDFEKGFIRAEVIPYAVFTEYKNRNAIKEAGQMQVEGKEYIVNDGDIMNFRFNV
ncbi:MAG: redox-regulated ATPase YchF [Phototrophicaceae bacterium]